MLETQGQQIQKFLSEWSREGQIMQSMREDWWKERNKLQLICYPGNKRTEIIIKDFFKKKGKLSWVKECSASPAQKSSQKTSKITKKRVTGFVLVKLSVLRIKKMPHNQPIRKKEVIYRRPKLALARFSLCKTGR